MSGTGASVFKVGLCCPLGGDFQAASAAYHERRRVMRREAALIGTDSLSPVVASVLPLAECRNMAERLLRLLRPALDECVADLALDAPPRVRLVLPTWAKEETFHRALLARVAEDGPSLLERAEFSYDDEVGAMTILAQASEETDGGPHDTTVVAAADSFIHPDRIDLLALQGRLHNKKNPYGLIPGEAAVAFLVGRKDALPGHRSLGRLRKLGTGVEAENPRRPAGLIGRGLAACYRNTLEGSEPGRLIADLTGERYRAEEFGFAVAATAPALSELAADPETPAAYMGHLGTATGFAMAAVALMDAPTDLRIELPPEAARRVSFVSISSLSGRRAAMLVERADNPGGDPS